MPHIESMISAQKINLAGSFFRDFYLKKVGGKILVSF